jgi:hypothetical protein
VTPGFIPDRSLSYLKLLVYFLQITKLPATAGFTSDRSLSYLQLLVHFLQITKLPATAGSFPAVTLRATSFPRLWP